MVTMRKIPAPYEFYFKTFERKLHTVFNRTIWIYSTVKMDGWLYFKNFLNTANLFSKLGMLKCSCNKNTPLEILWLFLPKATIMDIIPLIS